MSSLSKPVGLAPLVVLVSLLGHSIPASAASPMDDLLAGTPKGPWRRLFLDAMVVESQQGL